MVHVQKKPKLGPIKVRNEKIRLNSTLPYVGTKKEQKEHKIIFSTQNNPKYENLQSCTEKKEQRTKRTHE